MHAILPYVITYFRQATNYVGQAEIINYLPGMVNKFGTYVGA